MIKTKNKKKIPEGEGSSVSGVFMLGFEVGAGSTSFSVIYAC